MKYFIKGLILGTALHPGRRRTFLYSMVAMVPGTYLGLRLAAAIFFPRGHWSVLANFRDYSSG